LYHELKNAYEFIGFAQIDHINNITRAIFRPVLAAAQNDPDRIGTFCLYVLE
jgi:hypothetical protein